jgi:hypothetical protein
MYRLPKESIVATLLPPLLDQAQPAILVVCSFSNISSVIPSWISKITSLPFLLPAAAYFPLGEKPAEL